MPSNFTATTDYENSLRDVDTLIAYARVELTGGNEDNRKMFLKLAIVSCVTKLQVFIENILKEYHYLVVSGNKQQSLLPLHLRLNSLKLFTADNLIHKSLENPDTYNAAKFVEVHAIATKTNQLCDDNHNVVPHLQFETKFPLGKTGLTELIKLFKQVNGENIFENPPFDTNKINEILGRRHAIIHEDSAQQLTEETIENYRTILKSVADYIDTYLAQHL